MAGNPVLGFLEAQPVGDDARSTVTKMLRLLGIVVLAGFAVGVINALLMIAMGETYAGTTGAALATGAAIVGLVISLAITVAVCFWITLAIRAWSSGQATGNTHVLVIGILAAVFGLIGVLLGLAGVGGSALYGAGIPIAFTLVNALSLLVAAGEALCGILMLVNRGKAVTTNTTGTPTRN
jgi:hypothetical protein